MANPNQEVKYTKIFINNEFVNSKSGKTFPTMNPATGKKLADIAEGDKVDIELAVVAAKKAFARGSVWRNMNASARGTLVNKLADLIERDINAIANLETLDNGKPFEDSIMNVNASLSILRYFAGWADKVHGKTIPQDGPQFALTRKEPIGVVGHIIPWNYPLLLFVNKFGPSIVTGNTIIIKPAEQTPLTALYIAALCKEAGFPAGVVNVVPGFGPTAGAAISEHQDIRAVNFTGSPEVGQIIAAAAAKSNLKRVALELGGKSPLVIFDDVDLDEAVGIAHLGIFSNHGQNCCAASRTFVQEGIYDAFVKKAAELAKKRKVGNPFEKGIQQGPQVDDEMFKKILGYIEAGKKEGAKLEAGGNRIGTTGYFIEPTVFSNVTDNMKIAKEEIFGPVQSIIKFKTLDEVIERANATNYGLAAGVLTKNLNNALVFSQAVEAGSVWVNCYGAVTPQTPFGGYKMSGYGREYNEEALDMYLETKTISIKVPCKN